MSTKQTWNTEQQQCLKQIVQKRKNLTWNEIANEMNKFFPEKCRTGKQYRERYVNYVQFQQNNIKCNSWTLLQQQELFKVYRQIGTKWTIIAKIIPTKSQNSLKNKFYGALRKTLRKINRIGKQNIKKFNKLIRYQSLMRVMDAAQGGEELPHEIKINSMDIKKCILDMAENCQEQFNVDLVAQIIKKIHKFNIATRCYSSKKWKKSPHHTGSNQQQSSNVETNSQLHSPDSEEAGSPKNPQKLSSSFQQKLQQKGRLPKQNNLKIKQQKQQNEQNQYIKFKKIEVINSQQKILVEVQKNNRKDSLIEVYASYAHHASSSLIKDDLDYQLCGILHQNYVPQYFNYFEE